MFRILATLFFLHFSLASEALAFDSYIVLEDGDEAVNLVLTGQAVRKKFIFDVYKLAHYQEIRLPVKPKVNRESVIKEILSGTKLQQISLVFERNLKAKQIQDALENGVRRHCNEQELSAVESDLALFRKAINRDVEKNDVFELRWLPDGNLISLYENEVISTITNPLLAKMLWSIWFADDRVIDRDELISNVI